MTADDESSMWMETIKAARARVDACEGATLRAELFSVGRIYHVFAVNGREFQEHLLADLDPAQYVARWDIRHPERFEEFLAETDRLLHNFLAGAASLRDHTRRLWTKYPPKDEYLTTEFTLRINETFATSPLARFVQELRNLTVHRSLPVVGGRLSFTGGENVSWNSATGLRKQALVAGSKGWHAAA